MKLLVLGGGGFLGYHAAAEAVGAGHRVTTFSRNETPPVPGAEHLVGDRTDNLSGLEGRSWDAVFDTFSDPEAVGRTARLFSGVAGVYGYVSGISVYHPEGPDLVGETDPVRREKDDLKDDPLQARSIAKLRCERAVNGSFDGPVLVVRPGIMVGPRDPTDRFTYWPLRYLRALEDAARTGTVQNVLAPGDPDRPVQFTDARDLGAWTVRAMERGLSGVFNTVGPDAEGSVTARDALDGCLEAARAVFGERHGAVPPDGVRTVWREERRLRRALEGVPEEKRPLWFPEDQIPFSRVDASRAFAEGLSFRPVRSTARDALDFALENPRKGGILAGLPAGMEGGPSAGRRDG